MDRWYASFIVGIAVFLAIFSSKMIGNQQ